MVLVDRNRVAVILLLCVALLCTRTLGDHLHFCFDGQEPPVSLHGNDGEMHHVKVAGGSGHNDRDYDLSPVTAAKVEGSTESNTHAAIFLLAAVFAPFVSPARIVSLLSATPAPLSAVFRNIRPPLRGPPR